MVDESDREEFERVKFDYLVLREEDSNKGGLWKLEFQGGREFVGPGPKNYVLSKVHPDELEMVASATSQKPLIKCRGISKKTSSLKMANFKKALFEQEPSYQTNKGFKLNNDDNFMYSYECVKKAISFLYLKREICDNFYETKSLPDEYNF